MREEDEPKPALVAAFGINDVQADAILNMRLRALRRLEEEAIRREHEALEAERGQLEKLANSTRRQKTALIAEIAEIKTRFGQEDRARRPPHRHRRGTPAAGRARGGTGGARAHHRDLLGQGMDPRDQGPWPKAETAVRYKDGDRERFRFHAETTDKLLIFATNGRFYTLAADRLPGGRGFGEPVRLMVDLGNDHEAVALFAHHPGRRLLVAASDGRGFFVLEDEVVAQTRTGRQVLNPAQGAEATVCVEAAGDTVAVVGTNRRLLVFPAGEVPTMTRGRGVILQRYRDAALSDVQVFDGAAGLRWRSGTGARTETALDQWHGKRGQAGRAAPRGFPAANRFL